MSATGTDDRFLLAAFVEGNSSGVSECNFLGNAQISPRAIALDTTVLCRMESHLRTVSPPGLPSSKTPLVGIDGYELIQHP